MPITAIVRTPYLFVFDDTAAVGVPQVLSARAAHGRDMRIAEATVRCTAIPAGTHYYDQISIVMGATAETAVTRFVGYLVDYDRAHWPREVTLLLRGRLILAEIMDNTHVGGTDLVEGVGATDQDIVTSVLETCGLDGGLVFIGGTGRTLGTVARDSYLWAEGEKALAYIERLDEICLGYRTFDDPSGVVTRRAVSTVGALADQIITVTGTSGDWALTALGLTQTWAYNVSAADVQTGLEIIYGAGTVTVAETGSAPRVYTISFVGDRATYVQPLITVHDDSLAGAGHGVTCTYAPAVVVATFTEGVDILPGASSSTTILPARNRVQVQGYTKQGSTFAPFHFEAEADNVSIPDPPGHITEQFSSPLLEKSLAADGVPGVGISCEEAAGWRLGEVKHQQQKVSFSTYRDDLILPGDVVAVVAPVRLAVDTKVTVQRVEVEIDEKNVWTQTLSGVTGPDEG